MRFRNVLRLLATIAWMHQMNPGTVHAKGALIEVVPGAGGSIAGQTKHIQEAIDAMAKAGGGTVVFPPGRYVCGAITLRSHVHVQLREGAVLAGSPSWEDYGSGKWADALLTGHGVRDVWISGPGILDGSNVTRQGGEGGYRGPHTISFEDSSDLRMENLTIRDSGNYAILCKGVVDASFVNLTVLDGHDGLHIQDCTRITIKDCDFRTGNDCVAGTDNTHVTVTGSRFNTACHAFRLGVQHFRVRDCHFQGPGEFPDKWSVRQGTPRHAMLAAFIHFSPLDRSPKIPSDDWLIEDSTMDQLESIYAYDHENGRWQEGQPAKKIQFRNITATRMAGPLRVVGDARRQLDLTLQNVSITPTPDREEQAVLEISRFGRLRLIQVALNGRGDHTKIRLSEGTHLEWDETTMQLASEIQNVSSVRRIQKQAVPSGPGE